jgi:hypothetical protein
MNQLERDMAAIFGEPDPSRNGRHAPAVPAVPAVARTPTRARFTPDEPVMVRLQDVQPAAVEWLWPEKFAIGKLSLIVGDPDKGKSLLTLDMAARVSAGRAWPDAMAGSNPAGDVLLLGAEDDLEDTIRPRLNAAEADCARIHALVAKRVMIHPEAETTAERGIALDTDLPLLRKAIEAQRRCRLVVIDPISAFLGETESHNNAAVRAMLAPLSKLANDLRVAVVAVQHLNKAAGMNAIYRASGSLAFPAAARSVMAVGVDQEAPNRRLFVPVKNNLTANKTGLAFHIESHPLGQPVLHWESEPISETAEEVLNANITTERGSARQEAVEFLKAELSDGAVDAKVIIKNAAQQEISRKTLIRAQKEIGIVPKKFGYGRAGRWVWELPQAIGGQVDE